MNMRRLLLYLVALVVIFAAGIGLALYGLRACAPPPLPGDEAWTYWGQFYQSLDIVSRGLETRCFTRDAGGTGALWVAGHALWLLLALLAGMLAWEVAGRPLRLAWLGARGGHAILAGGPDDLWRLVQQQRRLQPTLLFAADSGAAAAFARKWPFAEVTYVNDRAGIAGELQRLGVSKAKLVAAASRNDLTNVAIAEVGLEAGGSSELLVRLEQPSVRALSSHRLRQKAEQQGRGLSVVSLSALQVRRGMAASMWGRYTLDGHPRVHIAICGSGPGLQAVAYEIARQGFGLEADKPLLSILRTGTADFSAGALERLVASVGCEVQVTAAAAATPGAIDPAIATILADHPPLLAVHCIAETEGEAEELAQRWEDVLALEHQPVPPIVAYTSETRPLGRTGMIRVADAPDLAEALAVEQLMDRRAIAVHEQFLSAQRAARGAAFGDAPAEVPWARLAENFRDDNRAVADQMDYKLARVRMLSQPGNDGAQLTAEAIDGLAAVAHARWMAARSLAGWTYAEKRDNKRLHHPDLLPFSSLDEAAKQKDRDEVMTLPELAELAGEALRREHRVAVSQPLGGEALENLLDTFATMAISEVPVAVIPAGDPAMLETAEALLAKDYAIEVVLDAMEPASNPDHATRRAAIIRAAYRIHVARDRTAREAAADEAREDSHA